MMHVGFRSTPLPLSRFLCGFRGERRGDVLIQILDPDWMPGRPRSGSIESQSSHTPTSIKRIRRTGHDLDFSGERRRFDLSQYAAAPRERI